MIRIADVGRFEKTFATMLSSFYHDADLSFEHISQRIIESNYFDFLEQNDWDAFEAYCAKTYQAMLKEMFGFDFNKELSYGIGAVYWAGLAYTKTSMNYQIPLNQLILLCPLRKMVSYFNPYHEMDFSRICNKLFEQDCHISILKSLRKARGYTVPQLSFLTGISKTTLLYYELDNDHLFKASLDSISALARVLKADQSLFRRRSFFSPISYFILTDPEHSRSIIRTLCEYYGLPLSESLGLHFQEEGQGNGLFIGQRNLLVVNRKTISVPDSVLEAIVYKEISSIPPQTQLLY